MANFFVCVYLASPFWALALPFISSNRVYRWISYAVCCFFFSVEPIGTGLVDRAAEGGLGFFLSLGVTVLAALFGAILLAVTRQRFHRIYFIVMLGSAVVGFLGALLVR